MNQKAILLLALLILALDCTATIPLTLDASIYPNPGYNYCDLNWASDNSISYTGDFNLTYDLSNGAYVEGGGNLPMGGMYSFGDLDGDGKIDMVQNKCYGDPENVHALIYLNTGTNSHPIYSTFSTTIDLGYNDCFAGNNINHAIAVCDFNQDGRNEIIAVTKYGNQTALRVFRNNGDLTFTDTNNVVQLDTTLINPYYSRMGLDCRDLDHDGYPDLIVNNLNVPGSAQNILLYKNTNGDGQGVQLQNTITGESLPGTNGGYTASLLDLSGDGKLDIYTGTTTTYPIGWDILTKTKRYALNTSTSDTRGVWPTFGTMRDYTGFRPRSLLARENPFDITGQIVDQNRTTCGANNCGLGIDDFNGGYYNVERDGVVINTNPIQAKTYADTALNYLTSYSYQVKSYNGQTLKDTSNTLTCSTINYPFTITNIENLGSYYFASIHLVPADETKDLIVRIDHNYNYPADVNITINNSLTDGRQYFVYTSSDGITWVFNDSLTNGTTYSNPMQKIWDTNLSKYTYTFQDSFLPNDTHFYKFTYRLPSRYYQTVVNSPGWSNQLEPTQQDLNGITRDVWTVNYYSNINSKNLDATAIIRNEALTTNVVSYELQFNAQKTTSDAVNLIVEKYNDRNYQETVIATIPLTSVEHRYSVPITLSDANEFIKIKTTAQTFSSNVILNDYALEEKNYFKDRLQLLKDTFEPLNVWIDVNAGSYQYIEEGKAFRFFSNTYDREGQLTQTKVKVYAYGVNDANLVFSHDYNISGGPIENLLSLSEIINPIYIIHDGGTTGVNSPIKVVLTLCDANGCVAEQSAFIMLHNYPYFTTDFFLQNQEQSRTLNTGPHGRFFIQSRQPDTVNALRVRIYLGTFFCAKDQNGETIDGTLCDGNRVAPDTNKILDKYLYRGKDFNCDTTENCSFDYDFGNDFHYFYETGHTAITNLYFNTSDSNDFWARTQYIIGRQPMQASITLQDVPPQSATDQNCYPAIFGTRLKSASYATVEDLRNALRGNTQLRPYLGFNQGWTGFLLGLIGQNDFDNFTNAVFLNGGNVPDNFMGTIFGLLIDSSGCKMQTNTNQAYKVVARVLADQGKDIHQYLKASFNVNELTGAGAVQRAFTNKFYPITTFYDNRTNDNWIVWNTNLFDENGKSLNDLNHYRLDLSFTDLSLQHNDTTGQLFFDTNNSVTFDANNSFQVIPQTFFAISPDGTTSIQAAVKTQALTLDQIEITLYTQYSSFDPLKTDKENQIVHFNFGIEDLLKIETKPSFSLTRDWNDFASRKTGTYGGLCYYNPDNTYSSALLNPNAKADIIQIAAINFSRSHPNLFRIPTTAIADCGVNGIVNVVSSNLNDYQIQKELEAKYGDFLGKSYRQIRLNFKNFAVNDYAELQKLGGFTDKNTNATTIISQLATQGKSQPMPDIRIELEGTGRVYTLPNYLVGMATVNDLIRQHEGIKMRIVYKTNYFKNSTTDTLDFYDIQATPKNLDFFKALEQFAIDVFNNNAVTIFLLAILIVLLVAVTRIGANGGK